MNNDLVLSDQAYSQIVAAGRTRLSLGSGKLPVRISPDTGLAPTYLVSRHEGGVGASTLIAMLLPLLVNPFLIEIGGNMPRALQSVAPADRARYESGDPDSYKNAIDRRLEVASRIAIIEFEQSLFREAVEVAQFLSGEGCRGAVTLMLVASKIDKKLGLLKHAKDSGIQEVIVFGQACLAKEERPGVIHIPVLPENIQNSLYEQKQGFADAVRARERLYTAHLFKASLQKFYREIEARIGQ